MSEATTSSTYTRAIPACGPRKPIQYADVPLKVNVARAPAVLDSMAEPPLHALDVVSRVQPAVKLIDGSVSSNRVCPGGLLNTVTPTGEEVAVLPAAKRATAVRVCEALPVVVVSQDIEYGAAVTSAPRLAPSSRYCTPATVPPETLTVIMIVPLTAAPDGGELMLTVPATSGATSKASTTTKVPVESGFFVPVTSIISV